MQVLNDFDTSLRKALTEIDPKWEEYRGLIVCGTHNPHNVEDMIKHIEVARQLNYPFLGICFGHQLAYIEYARNVLGVEDATSEEFGQGTFVVVKRDSLKVGQQEGETWWNNYEIPKELEENWEKPTNFITCQYHPEYQSSKEKPHPLLVKFIELCKSK